MTQSVSTGLDEEVLNKLDVLTKAAERSRAWLMAHAIEQYVQHESWQIEAIQTTLNKIRNGNPQFANDEETYGGCKAGAVIRDLKRHMQIRWQEMPSTIFLRCGNTSHRPFSGCTTIAGKILEAASLLGNIRCSAKRGRYLLYTRICHKQDTLHIVYLPRANSVTILRIFHQMQQW